MSVGFHRDCDARQLEVTNNKKGKYHVRIYLKDIIGFAQHQLKGTYGLGYLLTLTRNNDSAALNKDNAINDAEIKINSIHCYVPHYTPSIARQATLFKQIQSKTPTQLEHPERSTLMKEVNTRNLWSFELRTQESINVPIWIFIGFQQMDRQNSQSLNKDTFFRPPLTNAHVVIGTERYLDNSLSLNYNDDDFSQGYGQIKEAFNALTQDDILQPYISEHDFRSTNDVDNKEWFIRFRYTISEKL